MYLDFFKLKAEPFGITPDPDFFYLSPGHKEALASLIYGVKMRKGFVAITGEAGVGKTTVIRSYLDSLDSRSVKVVYLFNSNVTFSALLNTVFRELGIVAKASSVYVMIDQLHRELIDYYRKGINVVLIIDEAQNMPVGTLENLRMLSNLETTKEKLIQIIFSGQPEFDRILARADLRQLRQRIAVRVIIRSLSGTESREYIRHRVARASAGKHLIFTTAAVHSIAGRAKGIPRTINILCGNCLVTAFGYNKKHVGYRVAVEVASDMEGVPRSSPIMAYGGALLALLITFAASQFVPRAVSGVASMVSSSVPTITKRVVQLQPATNYPQVVQDATPAQPAEEAVKAKAVEGREPIPEPDQKADEESVVSPERPLVVNRVVSRGDTLTRLTQDVYGVANDELIYRVARNNPGINDVNIIFEGDSIAFPVDRPLRESPGE